MEPNLFEQIDHALGRVDVELAHLPEFRIARMAVRATRLRIRHAAHLPAAERTEVYTEAARILDALISDLQRAQRPSVLH